MRDRNDDDERGEQTKVSQCSEMLGSRGLLWGVEGVVKPSHCGSSMLLPSSLSSVASSQYNQGEGGRGQQHRARTEKTSRRHLGSWG
jgi:hypothetical protein